MLKGKIMSLNEDGTALIKAQLPLGQALHRNVREVYIDMIDSRPLSDKQRRMCYALTNAIADWDGNTREDEHLYRKFAFTAARKEEFPELTERLFSLSTASMSLIAAYQSYLVKFIIENDIPTKFPLREYANDIEAYTYLCLVRRKCAVCGRRAEAHHIDAIGMGNNRDEVQHEGREVMSLCREHHTEIHTIGYDAFMQKYHLDGGVPADRTIMKIYNWRR